MILLPFRNSGLAVCMEGHIGVYIGNGEVIEAKGNHDGVVKTKLSEGRLDTLDAATPNHLFDRWNAPIRNPKKVVLEKRKNQRNTTGVVSGKGDFQWPLPAPYGKDWITDTAGARWNPYTHMYENAHGAIDIERLR